MGLKAQLVQSIGDLVLVRIYNPSHDGIENDDRVNDASLSSEQDILALIDQSSSQKVSSWVMSAARLLQDQWPRQDREKEQSTTESELCGDNNDSDDDAYYRKFLVHHEKSCPRYSLACSYILLQKNSQNPYEANVVGHGRLTECYESAGGNAVAATYILIDPQYRGKGFGRTLLFLLEQEAKSKERLRCDYHFVYLWCKATTAPFYERSGYRLSKNRVSLQRPCLKSLTATSVQSLEDVLLRRRRQPSQDKNTPSAAMTNDSNSVGTVTKKMETIMLLPSQSQSNKAHGMEQPPVEDDVWLRKRLVDHVESTIVSEEDRRIEIQQFVIPTNARRIISHDHTTNMIIVTDQQNSKYCYRYHWNPHIPWQMQIGPTCGLTAIRMIRDFYTTPKTSGEGEAQMDSLLTNAQKRGFTDDGEMFDADQLRDLMKDQLLATATANIAAEGVIVKTHVTSSLTTKEIESTIQKGGVWIIPYDSNPRTKLPGNFRGLHAHWGIVVGILYSRNMTEADKVDLPTVDSDVELVVQHSLSSKWAIASKKTWIDSNCQLISVNQDKFSLGNGKKLNLSGKIIQVVPKV